VAFDVRRFAPRCDTSHIVEEIPTVLPCQRDGVTHEGPTSLHHQSLFEGRAAGTEGNFADFLFLNYGIASERKRH